MKSRRAIVAKVLLFTLLFCSVYLFLEQVFLLKGSSYKYKNYLAQERNSVDILILGSSHSNSGIDPGIINGDLGVKSFNYSLNGMRIEQLLYIFRDALRTQTPQIAILDTFSFVSAPQEYMEIYTHRAFDHLPISLNKINAINTGIPGEKSSYYLPFIKYHTRWKELKANDIRDVFEKNPRPSMGFAGTNKTEQMEAMSMEAPILPVTEVQSITPSHEILLGEFLSVAEENNVYVLFVTVPYLKQEGWDYVENARVNNYLREKYVNGNTIQLIDLNEYWDKMDFSCMDLGDPGHVNRFGAEKVSRFLVEYIEQNYRILLERKPR